VGRVTRGTPNNLFSPLPVQGPMARNIPDLALFLHTMAGWCPLDPLTHDAPERPYAESVAWAEEFAPKRVAFTVDYGDALAVDEETRAICVAAIRRFEEIGCVVVEAFPALGELPEAMLVLRSQHFVVDRELQLRDQRDSLKPDIIWNTERGLAATPSQLAWAERERAAFYRRCVEMFARFDVFVTPSAPTPAFDVMLRAPAVIAGRPLDNDMGRSMLNAAMTMAASPSVALPCGFDRFGRPVGLQVSAPPRRDERALVAAALFERVTGLDRLLPIEPRPGVVPG
jgi:amidase